MNISTVEVVGGDTRLFTVKPGVSGLLALREAQCLLSTIADLADEMGDDSSPPRNKAYAVQNLALMANTLLEALPLNDLEGGAA